MRTWTIAVVSCAALAGGCKKKGGGGGAWLVGDDGLMANVHPDGAVGTYDPGTDGDLRGITCLDDETAFVVGDGGVFLRTFDGGRTWERRDLGTTAALWRVDAAWPGSIYVAADDGLYHSADLGHSWTRVSDTPDWRAVTVDDDGATSLALTASGDVWIDGAITTRIPGARGVHVSHDGRVAAIAGDDGAILRRVDGGAWEAFSVDGAPDLRGVWANEDEVITAVGDDGVFAAVTADGAVRAAGFGGPDLHAVYLEPTVGYAVGDDGAVYRLDGGSWSRLDLGLTGRILAVEDLDGGW